MDENIQQLKKKTIISTLSLFIQSGYSALLGFAANLVLTIVLSPRIFGIYITVLSVISLLNYFSDIGLAASLVQKKEVTDEDVKTTFTIQQILIITTIAVGYFASSFIQNFYKLPLEGIYLYWALLAGFFLSSLKTIPSIFLERKVQFQRIVLVQVVENSVFYLTVIMLGILGFSLTSFTIAVILRSITGLILIYIISPWMPKLGISKTSSKQLLSFGIPFQTSSFLALFKDDLITLYLGKVLGFEALGYIGWAKKWAEAPIRIIMDNVNRVLFPVLSRIQHDKEKVSTLIGKILHYQTLLLSPIIIGMMSVMGLFVEIVPRYSKWQPALPLFYLMAIAGFFSSYSTPFINLFNALGRVKISFMFMVFWTVCTWILTPTLSKLYGMFGFPIVQVFLSLTSLLVLSKAKRIVAFPFIDSVYKPILSGLIMGVFLLLLRPFFPATVVSMTLYVGLGAGVYFLSVRYLFGIDIMREFKQLFIYD